MLLKFLNEGKKEAIIAIAFLARQCINLNGKNRPTMMEVAMEFGKKQKVSRRGPFRREFSSRG